MHRAIAIWIDFYVLLGGIVLIGMLSLGINGYWGSKFLPTYKQFKQIKRHAILLLDLFIRSFHCVFVLETCDYPK